MRAPRFKSGYNMPLANQGADNSERSAWLNALSGLMLL